MVKISTKCSEVCKFNQDINIISWMNKWKSILELALYKYLFAFMVYRDELLNNVAVLHYFIDSQNSSRIFKFLLPWLDLQKIAPVRTQTH